MGCCRKKSQGELAVGLNVTQFVKELRSLPSLPSLDIPKSLPTDWMAAR